MKKYFLFFILLISLCCGSYATTTLDRDFYVKTGLQLDAIKRLITNRSDSASFDSQLVQKVDSLLLFSWSHWEVVGRSDYMQKLQTLKFDSLIGYNSLNHAYPVFFILDGQNVYDDTNHLPSGYGAFYDLVGNFPYADLTDVPTISKQVLAVMGIDTDKEFKIYTAVWHIITSYFGDVPPFFDYPSNSVDILSHLDMIAVYTAICCDKFNTYHLYFPQMGDFNN